MHDNDKLMGTEDILTQNLVFNLSYTIKEAMDLPTILREDDNFLVIDLGNIRGWITRDQGNYTTLLWTILTGNGPKRQWMPLL